jgi:hypothetical protein
MELINPTVADNFETYGLLALLEFNNGVVVSERRLRTSSEVTVILPDVGGVIAFKNSKTFAKFLQKKAVSHYY